MDGISEDCGVGQAAAVPVQSEPVVTVRGLVKRYGSRKAVAGIDLEVRRGEIFAFLGPNGAGDGSHHVRTSVRSDRRQGTATAPPQRCGPGWRPQAHRQRTGNRYPGRLTIFNSA
jgi:hypothetical protein